MGFALAFDCQQHFVLTKDSARNGKDTRIFFRFSQTF